MNVKKKILLKRISRAFLASVILIIIAFAVSVLIQYRQSINDATISKASYELDRVELSFEQAVDPILEESRTIYEQMTGVETTQDLCMYLEELTTKCIKGEISSNFKFGRFVKDDKIYVAGGSEYITANPDRSAVIDAVKKYKSISLAGIYSVNDMGTNMNLAIIVIPYAKGDICDGIALYYTPNIIDNLIDIEEDKSNNLFVLKDQEYVVKSFKNENSIDTNNFKNELKEKITNNNQLTDFNSMFSIKDTILKLTFDEDNCIACLRQIKSTNLSVFAVYKEDILIDEDYSFYRSITGIFIVSVVLAVTVAVIFIVRKLSLVAVANNDKYNRTFNCLTNLGFKSQAKEILEKNKNSQFALIISQVQFYSYYLNKDKGIEVEFMEFIRLYFRSRLTSNELYGYDSNGTLYFLLYAPNVDQFKKRLAEIDKYCAKFKMDDNKRLKLLHGVTITHGGANFLTALENSKRVLEETCEQSGLRNFAIYEETVDQDRLEREFVEVNIEGALARGDFKMFYQPKYNIKGNRIDSSEALVRWFMPEEKRFYPPGSFIPIIEENGFIVKLDKYVVEAVCKYIRTSLDRGEKVYPVSVNVSGITSKQEDFVDYYVSIKKKYKIRDGLLCLELTESALGGTIEQLRELEKKLHDNGFELSIDDFGTGYSSYSSLKYLKFDEIKLDRFFLDKGIDSKRDLDVITSTINLGKSLGMKVTVEGVSDQEKLDYLKELDCDVIQGYIYARPMPEADYISFINGGTKGSFN